MGGTGQKGEEAGKRNPTLSQRQVIPLLGVIIVEMGADQAGGQPAEVLFVINQSKPFLGGGVAEVVPVAEGWGREFLQDFFPEIVRGDFAGILAALQAKAKAQAKGRVKFKAKSKAEQMVKTEAKVSSRRTVVLGCPKCRGNHNGCARCHSPNFQGRRLQR